MNTANTPLYKQIKAARKEQSLSQRKLAEYAGVEQSQLSKIENGTIDPRLSSAIDIIHALGFHLMLVPKQKSSLVEAILKGYSLSDLASKPAYSLDDEEDEDDED